MSRAEMGRSDRPPLRGPAGFTLIEVMVVVAIVGVLAAIALPSYFDYVKRGKIIEGTGALSDFRQRYEQYFLDNRKYTGAGATYQPLINAQLQNFTVTYAESDVPPAYTLTATGVAAKGMSSFQYTIDQAGNKVTVSLPPDWGTPAGTCWSIRKGGDCF